MREKKKGFTLIELLAVIVILAVIALIATPIVLNLINTAKKGAFKRSVENTLRGAKLYYTSSLLQPSGAKEIIFTCQNNECISNNNEKLEISGNVGDGYVKIYSDGNVEMLVTDENYYAAKPKEGEVIIDKGNGSHVDLTNDTTPPDIYSVTTVVTTNSIRVSVGAKDNESGIYGYEYSIDGGENYTDIIRNNTYIFEGLKNDKTYEVKVRVYNGIYGKDTYSDEKGRNEKEFENNPISLKTIETPEFTILPEGWSLEKEVTINYKEATIKEYNIGDGFKEYTGPFKVEDNIDIIAKASDGQNEVKITANIRTIDREKPTVEVSDINTSYDKKDEITLTLSDNLSGVTSYCVTSESTSDNCTWISGNGSIKYTIDINGTYYAYSKDAVGNISEGKDFLIDKIDTEEPTASLELESKTTNSITVKATCTDNVGITTYEYSYNNGVNYEIGTNDTYTFSNLTTGTYNLKVKCSDEAGNSAIGNVTVDTEDLGIPSFSVSPSGWAPSKTVTIKYNDTKNIHQYIIERGTATKEDGTKLENNKIYSTNSDTEKIIFTSDGSITAIITDGTNTVSAPSQLVSDIEAVKPTDMTLSINSDTRYEKTKSVTVTLKDTGGSGLAAGSIKYGWSTSNSTAPSSYTPVNTSATSGTNTTTFKASGSGLTGSYYLWVVPVTYKDNAGNSNTTTVKSTGTFKFDNTVPTLTLGTVSTTKDTITVPYTASDSDSKIDTTTCVYGKSTSYGSNGTISGSNCVMSGLNSNTTYYYKVITTDKAGNSTYKTGSSTTVSCSTASASAYCGCLYPNYSNVYSTDATNYKTCVDSAPSISSLIVTKATSSSISVKATATNATKYEFKINSGGYINNGTTTTYTFNNLTPDSHTIYLRVTNSFGISESKNVSIDTTCFANIGGRCGLYGAGTYTSCSVSLVAPCSCICSSG